MNLKKVMAGATLAGAVLGFSSHSLAQSAPQTGWYVGGSIGQSQTDEFCDNFGGPGVSCDDKDSAWRILGGYRFSRNFAAEFGFHQLGEVGASVPGASLSAEANAWELLAVGSLPVSSQFSVYGKAGLFRGETEISATLGGLAGSEDESTTDLTFGFGVQFDVSAQVGIRGEWQRYRNLGDDDTIGEGDVDVMSIGVVVRF